MARTKKNCCRSKIILGNVSYFLSASTVVGQPIETRKKVFDRVYIYKLLEAISTLFDYLMRHLCT